MPWFVVQTNLSIHVLPEHDSIKHTTLSPCWCHPRPDPECDNNWIHNNFMPDAEGNGEEPEDGKYN